MKNILGKKIEILPNTPKENQIICDVCGGTGWLQDDKETYIEKCKCNNGMWDICQYCGKPLKYPYTRRCDCKEYILNEKIERNKRYAEHEESLLTKSKVKTTLFEADKSKVEMMYSNVYPYNEGYFSDIEELEGWCEENEVEMPNYVWGTYKTKISIDGESIVESACDDLHEGAFSNVTNLDVLQEFLNEWCDKQTGTDTYYVDYDYVILL